MDIDKLRAYKAKLQQQVNNRYIPTKQQSEDDIDPDDYDYSDVYLDDDYEKLQNANKYTLLQQLLRQAGRTGRGLVGGIDDLANLLTLGYHNNGLTRYIDYHTDNRLKPLNQLEKDVDSVVRGLSSWGAGTKVAKIGLEGLKGASKVGGNALKFLTGSTPTITNAAQYAATNLVADKMADLDYGVGDTMLATTLAGMGIGAGGNALKHAVDLKFNPKLMAASALPKIDQERLAAFNRAGLKPTMGDLTDNTMLKFFQNISKRNLINDAGKKLEDNRLFNIEQAKKNLALDTSQSINDKADFGDFSKEMAKQLKQEAFDTYKMNKEKAESLINSSKKVPLSNLEEFYKKHYVNAPPASIDTSKQSGAYNVVKKFIEEDKATKLLTDPNLIDKEWNKYKDTGNFTKDKPTKNIRKAEIKEIRDVISGDAPDAKYYQPSIGTKPKDGLFQNSITQLKKDLNNAYDELGTPEQVKAIKKANVEFSAYKKKVEPVLQEMINDKADYDIANHFINRFKKGDSRIFNVINIMPQDKQVMYKSALLRNLGINKNGEVVAKQAADNFFALPQRVQNALFKNIPESKQQAIKDTFEAMRAMGETSLAVNTSGTGPTNELYALFGDLGKLVTKREIAPIASRLAGYIGINAINKHIMLNPDVINTIVYAQNLKSKSQVPVLLNMMKKTDLFSDKTISKLSDVYFDRKNEGLIKKGTRSTVRNLRSSLSAVKRRENDKEDEKR